MANKLKVILFLGSTRDGRMGERVAIFMEEQMKKRNFDVSVFDPLAMDFPMLRKPSHFYGPERKGAPEWLLQSERQVKEADAYLLVSAEYNHCIPPALSNMLDHFPCSFYSYKPSGIVTYSMGQFGGMRAAMQLRALTGELGCISVSNIFGIPQVQKAFDEKGTPLNDYMTSGATKLLDQLEWMAHAMKNHRDTNGVPGENRGQTKK
ncbi:hypothetical protein FSP39_000308 [Pinctada imbricata]|uniref:NADPH-dependent FMN reductase-like domain-containing protein n=1 Tax=Pinctada imbricata TaxID=66713 RepID=A0AA89BMM4_PINIB|nr:hypothetical protein FSP39_000308 [Pinctada imbricata]